MLPIKIKKNVKDACNVRQCKCDEKFISLKNNLPYFLNIKFLNFLPRHIKVLQDSQVVRHTSHSLPCILQVRKILIHQGDNNRFKKKAVGSWQSGMLKIVFSITSMLQLCIFSCCFQDRCRRCSWGNCQKRGLNYGLQDRAGPQTYWTYPFNIPVLILWPRDTHTHTLLPSPAFVVWDVR